MKYVLVTGAYGGMGRATVSALVAQGYGVFALDRQVGGPSENVYPIAADVTDSASLAAAADVVAKVTDKLFAVVHFAGVYMMDSLVEMDESAFRRIVDINLTGAYLVNKTFGIYWATAVALSSRQASLLRSIRCRLQVSTP